MKPIEIVKLRKKKLEADICSKLKEFYDEVGYTTIQIKVLPYNTGAEQNVPDVQITILDV